MTVQSYRHFVAISTANDLQANVTASLLSVLQELIIIVKYQQQHLEIGSVFL